MMATCPVCGKLTAIHWPEFWPQRRGEMFFCSWNCYEVSLAQDLNKMHKAMRKRRGKIMARMKKDGTPAKKPGRKPGIESLDDMRKVKEKTDRVMEQVDQKMMKPETPEGTLADAMAGMKDATEVFFGKCQDMGLKVEAPETPFEKKLLELKIVGVEGEFGRFVYDKRHSEIIWTSPDGEEIGMDPIDWRMFSKQMPRVIDVLMAEG